MEYYDEIRELYKDTLIQDRLNAVRMESIRLLGPALNYCLIMKHLLDERKPENLPDDFATWCQTAATNIKEFQDLVEALTDKEHRSDRKEKRIERIKDKQRHEWEKLLVEVKELQGYESLFDAITKVSDVLNLPIPPSVKHDTSLYQYSLSNVVLKNTSRSVMVMVTAAFANQVYPNYHVRLKRLVDERNLTWSEHKVLSNSLKETARLINMWLVQENDIDDIQQQFS